MAAPSSPPSISPQTPPPPVTESSFNFSQATTIVRLSPTPSLIDEDETMYNDEDFQLQKRAKHSIIESIEEDEDVDMMIAAQLSSPCSNNSYEDLYLRGGVQRRVTTRKKITTEVTKTAIVVSDDDRYRPSRAELEGEEEEDEEYQDEGWQGSVEWKRKIDEMDVDDEDNDTGSNWDDYGDLPVVIGEYLEVLERIEGNENWNADQKKLHKLIYLRGLMPMIPSHWRLCFKMWGITAPHLDDVFTPTLSQKRVAIHCYGSVQAAGKALESLFYLSQYVTDYEELGMQEKSAPLIAKTLRNYIKWSIEDAGLDYRKNDPVIVVQAYQKNFADDAMSVNEEDSPELSDPEGEPLTEEEKQLQKFVRALDKDLEQRLKYLRRQWYQKLYDRERKQYRAPMPNLYGFAVIQHIVGVLSLDPNGVKNPIIVLEQVKLNERGHWLWNALSLALPVHMARDSLVNLRHTGFVQPLEPDTSDPDL
ncbi:hypothetical protein QBC38DRAFT_440030 [Podospora fimiseda]|uniref:Uncharacterized protein n=1 Tax=Podospora fimiseda TaxID=252190 RepID=A0AAN7H7L8_9PEZI|nr:hypothetical protein QBC38DRAFT_440030 [Podospora fimiseda]